MATPGRLPLIVAAVGGNALLRRGEPLDPAVQLRNVREAATALGRLADGARLVVTHGNGPQVGLLALDSEGGGHPMPLDVLDAETQGQIGYLLAIELGNALGHRPVVTLLTQVEVDPNDPAFAAPTKPIGPQYDETTARTLAAERGWRIRPDGDTWRRVVASPEPDRIVELATIRLLVDAGVVVVCAGGGGIPVRRTADGRREGLEAVIDKDLTAALLAAELGAERLLLLTDVDAVYDDFGTADARAIDTITPEDLAERTLDAGSMGPKAEAARRFAERGGDAVIGSLRDTERIAAGTAGTRVRLCDRRDETIRH